MSSLNTMANIGNADDIYALLVDLHAGRDDRESMKVNARLVLILANHIGDSNIIAEAIALAGTQRL